MISETAYLRFLTRTGLLERLLTASDLNDFVKKTKARCSVGRCSMMTAKSMLAWDDMEEM